MPDREILGRAYAYVYTENGQIHVLDDAELPLELLALEDYKGRTVRLLLITIQNGKSMIWIKGLREATMPGSAGSSWVLF